MKKRTEVFLVLLNIKFLIIFCVKNIKKKLTTFQKNIHVLRNFLLYVFRILFNNDPQQISINSAKKWPRKWYRNMNISEKMHNGENAFEVLLYLYKQCKNHAKDAFSVYKLIHFGNNDLKVFLIYNLPTFLGKMGIRINCNLEFFISDRDTMWNSSYIL